MRKFFIFICFMSVVCLIMSAHVWSDPQISILFIDFYPDKPVADIPFGIIFQFTNSGDKQLSGYAQATVYGNIYDKEGNVALKLNDKTYRLYNFLRGAKSGKYRLYVGILPPGPYTLKINVSAYSTAKKWKISKTGLEKVFDVE